MAAKDPLSRLIEIRELQRKAVALIPERNRLIRLAASRATEREIATAAGLSQSRIHQLLSSD